MFQIVVHPLGKSETGKFGGIDRLGEDSVLIYSY